MSTALEVRLGEDGREGASFDFENKFQRVGLEGIRKSLLSTKSRAIFQIIFPQWGKEKALLLFWLNTKG